MFTILSAPEVTPLLRTLPGLRSGLWPEHKFWFEGYGQASTNKGCRTLYGTREGFCRYDYEPLASDDIRLQCCCCHKCKHDL